MANHKVDGSKIRRITFALPPEMIFATKAAAAAEYCNVSTICRRALAEALTARGYLQEDQSD
jgi:hypothetical protein